MTVEEILNARTNKPLTTEEEDTLIRAEYKVTPESPKRIKRSVNVCIHSLDTYRNLDLIDDPVVLRTFISTTNFYAKYILCDLIRTNNPKPKCEKHFRLDEKYNDIQNSVFEYVCDRVNNIINAHHYTGFTSKKRRDFAKGMHGLEYFYSLLEEQGDEKTAVQIIVDSNLKPSLVPAKILHSPSYLTAYLKSKGYDQKVIDSVIAAMNDDPYTPEQETEFLSALKTKHRSLNQSLNKEVVHENLNEDYIIKLAAIKLHAKKMLLRTGAQEVPVTFNNYIPSTGNVAGEYDENDDTIKIFVTPDSRRCKEILTTTIHETIHKIQFYHMRHARLDLDSDVDIYGKDEMLRIYLGEDYYIKNYFQISYEVDARYNEDLEKYRIRRDSIKELYLYMKNKVLDVASQNRRALKQIDYRNASLYGVQRKHMHKTLRLDQLFDTVLQEEYESAKAKGTLPLLLKGLRSTAPIILYEYDITKSVCIRRSIEDIIYFYLTSTDKTEKEIYANLIKSYVSYQKHKDYEKNIRHIKLLLREKIVTLTTEEREYLTLCTKPTKKTKYHDEIERK